MNQLKYLYYSYRFRRANKRFWKMDDKTKSFSTLRQMQELDKEAMQYQNKIKGLGV